jgi:hypothetical protein
VKTGHLLFYTPVVCGIVPHQIHLLTPEATWWSDGGCSDNQDIVRA